VTGGIIELNIPSSVYRISSFGDATHASDMPCFKFCHTLAARPFIFKNPGGIFKNKSKKEIGCPANLQAFRLTGYGQLLST